MRKRGNNKIGWCHETRNPITGCKNKCDYCWVPGSKSRFIKKPDPQNEVAMHAYRRQIAAIMEPRVHPDRLEKMYRELKNTPPSRVFIGSTGDMFGPWIRSGAAVSPGHVKAVIETCRLLPQHRFLFLTKFPEGYGNYAFPDNCWCGTSVSGPGDIYRFSRLIRNVRPGRRFISLEPYLDYLDISRFYLNSAFASWLIIGGRSAVPEKNIPKFEPPEDWIRPFIAAAINYPRFNLYIKKNAGFRGEYRQFPPELQVE